MARRSTTIWLGAAALTVLVGCGTGPVPAATTGVITTAAAPSATSNPVTTTTEERRPTANPELTGDVTLAEVVSPGDELPGRAIDGVVAHTIRDNEAWWSATYRDLYGTAYTPISGGFYPGYQGRGDPIPGCPGPAPMTLDEIESFLALYCHTGDFFAYDDSASGPLTDLVDRHGTVVIAAILSHEWAHAIQIRAGIDLDQVPTILTEQQADCFAGAWAQHSFLGESDWIHLDDADIDAIVRFYGDVADPATDDPHGPQGHGSYLDRLGAFGLGFDQGPQRCVALIEEPLALLADVVPLGLTPSTVGGTPVESDIGGLNAYWGGAPITVWDSAARTAEPDCSDGFELPGPLLACPSTRVVLVDEPVETASSGRYDFGTMTLLANAWAFINSDPTPASTSPSAQEGRWCDVGRWAAHSGDQLGITITAADVDDGLRAIVDNTHDLPLLTAANAYRRGAVNRGC